MKLLSIIVSGLILFIGCSNDKTVPYNDDGLYRLIAAAKAVPAPVIGKNTEGSIALKRTIDKFNKIYKKAGYSFNASVIKLSKDMQEDPSITDRGTNVPWLIRWDVNIITSTAAKYNLDLGDYLDKETFMAINKIRQIQQPSKNE